MMAMKQTSKQTRGDAQARRISAKQTNTARSLMKMNSARPGPAHRRGPFSAARAAGCKFLPNLTARLHPTSGPAQPARQIKRRTFAFALLRFCVSAFLRFCAFALLLARSHGGPGDLSLPTFVAPARLGQSRGRALVAPLKGVLEGPRDGGACNSLARASCFSTHTNSKKNPAAAARRAPSIE